MNESGHFVNEGFGWECRRCREASGRGGAESPATGPDSLPRFFREGEAEEGGPRLSTPALARRVAGSRTRLRCPVCGVEEEFEG